MFSFVTPVFAETSYHNENYDNLGGISPNTTLLTTCSTYSTSPSSVVFISGITTSFTASSKCDFSGTLAWRVSGGSHNTISTSKTTVFGQTTHTGSFSIPAQASGTSVEIGVVTSSGSFIKTNTYTVQSALSLPTLKVSSFTTQSSESRVLVSWYNNSNLNWQLYVNDEFQSSGNAYYGAFSNIEFSAGYGVKSIVLKDSVSGETLASQTVGVKPSYFTFYWQNYFSRHSVSVQLGGMNPYSNSLVNVYNSYGKKVTSVYVNSDSFGFAQVNPYLCNVSSGWYTFSAVSGISNISYSVYIY